jgi:hypothetical protein
MAESFMQDMYFPNYAFYKGRNSIRQYCKTHSMIIKNWVGAVLFFQTISARLIWDQSVLRSSLIIIS